MKSTTKSRRNAAAALAALVASGMLAACGGAQSSSDGGGAVDENGTLRVSYPVVTSMDPKDQPEPTKMLIATWPVYDRLIQITPKSEYAPMLATDWTFSDDGKSVTLDLREGVTFSDGAAFDAEAVKANLDAFKAAEGTPLQMSLAGISKVSVVDADTVELGLAQPGTGVLDVLASPLGGSMVSPKALGSDNLDTEPVGTGAYVIDSFVPGQKVTYKRRTDDGGIWDEETGKPAKIEISTLAPDAQISALKSGQIDLAAWSQPADPFRTELDTDRLKQTVMDGVLTMVGINFNPKMKPFDDPRVRQAVNLAINRKGVVDAFMPDGTPRAQPWPEGLTGFDAGREDTYAQDVDQARDLLKDAGYADGLDGGEILVNNIGAFPQAAQAIQSDLAEVGIKVELRNVDGYALIDQWARSTASMNISFMTLSSINTTAWLNRLFVNPVFRPGGVEPELQKLIDAASQPALEGEELETAVAAVIDYATEQALYAPLWQGVGGVISAPTVQNLDNLASVNGGVADLRHVYLAK